MIILWITLRVLTFLMLLFLSPMDHPSWMYSPNGNCSAAAAYNFINKDPNHTKGWKWFWKMQLPQKFKTFLCLIFHNKFSTNLLRARRGITSSDPCPRCNNSPENLGHLFKECPKAFALWETIRSGLIMRDGFVNSTMD